MSVVFIVCSVPQGSVLVTHLFILYTADLTNKVMEHNVNFHAYAIDTQLYLHCHREDIRAAVQRLECCIT